MSKTILIVGASRGIGLGLAGEFASRGWRVIASERSRSDDLHAIDRVEVVTMDVTDSASPLPALPESLDAVILNAGISGARHQSSERATAEEVAEVMVTNAFGPARLAKALLPRVAHGGSIGFMSSLMGSISDSSGGYELYRSSKAALNMLAKGIAEQDAKSRDVEVLALHPGWVQTDMGGPNAPLSVSDSVRGLADVVESAGGGGFRYLDFTGKEIAF